MIPIEVRQFFSSGFGKTLLFKGKPGTGKTTLVLRYLMICVLMEIASTSHRVLTNLHPMENIHGLKGISMTTTNLYRCLMRASR